MSSDSGIYPNLSSVQSFSDVTSESFTAPQSVMSKISSPPMSPYDDSMISPRSTTSVTSPSYKGIMDVDENRLAATAMNSMKESRAAYICLLNFVRLIQWHHSSISMHAYSFCASACALISLYFVARVIMQCRFAGCMYASG